MRRPTPSLNRFLQNLWFCPKLSVQTSYRGPSQIFGTKIYEGPAPQTSLEFPRKKKKDRKNSNFFVFLNLWFWGSNLCTTFCAKKEKERKPQNPRVKTLTARLSARKNAAKKHFARKITTDLLLVFFVFGEKAKSRSAVIFPEKLEYHPRTKNLKFLRNSEGRGWIPRNRGFTKITGSTVVLLLREKRR